MAYNEVIHGPRHPQDPSKSLKSDPVPRMQCQGASLHLPKGNVMPLIVSATPPQQKIPQRVKTVQNFTAQLAMRSAAMMSPVWLLLALPGLLGHVVDLPGCPFEKQTAFCLGSTSCHDLAHAGLTCESIAQIQEGIGPVSHASGQSFGTVWDVGYCVMIQIDSVIMHVRSDGQH